MIFLYLLIAFVVGVLVGKFAFSTHTIEVAQKLDTGFVCDVCKEPASPLKTHFGKYRCPKHKAEQ